MVCALHSAVLGTSFDNVVNSHKQQLEVEPRGVKQHATVWWRRAVSPSTIHHTRYKVNASLVAVRTMRGRYCQNVGFPA